MTNKIVPSYLRLIALMDTIPDFADREEAMRLLPHVIEETSQNWISQHKSNCLAYGSLNKKKR